ncbi:hypothetical protein E2C01_046774 [Portunus trituberculatus]|uniref:Uncharacterized protein n=1 Tax=Portunus trituberculatus TaxID=210409 RepID=A0A5B7G8P1_PORTR|nr:hypothetical protein [Portunus trituberculatus]
MQAAPKGDSTTTTLPRHCRQDAGTCRDITRTPPHYNHTTNVTPPTYYHIVAFIPIHVRTSLIHAPPTYHHAIAHTKSPCIPQRSSSQRPYHTTVPTTITVTPPIAHKIFQHPP